MAISYAVMALIIVSTAAWVATDAPGRDWSGQSVGRNTAEWVAGVLLLWIVCFPAYLHFRQKAPLRGRSPAPGLPPVGAASVPTAASPSGSVAPPGFRPTERAPVPVIHAPPAPAPRARPSIRPGVAVALVVVLGAVGAFIYALQTGVIRGLPGGKTSAGQVVDKLKGAGLPVAEVEDGAPASVLTKRVSCDQTKVLHDTGGRPGIAVVCVGPPPEAGGAGVVTDQDKRAGAFVVQADDGDVLVIGLGWPPGMAERVHAALGDGAFAGA